MCAGLAGGATPAAAAASARARARRRPPPPHPRTPLRSSARAFHHTSAPRGSPSSPLCARSASAPRALARCEELASLCSPSPHRRSLPRTRPARRHCTSASAPVTRPRARISSSPVVSDPHSAPLTSTPPATSPRLPERRAPIATRPRTDSPADAPPRARTPSAPAPPAPLHTARHQTALQTPDTCRQSSSAHTRSWSSSPPRAVSVRRRSPGVTPAATPAPPAPRRRGAGVPPRRPPSSLGRPAPPGAPALPRPPPPRIRGLLDRAGRVSELL